MRLARVLVAVSIAACGRIDFEALQAPADSAAADSAADSAALLGPAHYWPLDEAPGATTATDTIGAATATLTAPAAFTAGHSRDALASNAGGFASVATTPADLLGVAQLTVSAWLQRAAPGAVEQVGQELNGQRPGSNEISIQAWNDGLIYFCLGTDGQCGTTPVANDTSWHLVTLVFDGTQATDATRLVGYVDGAAQVLTRNAAPAIPALTPTVATRFDLGGVTDNEGFDTGTIDDVRIYDRALAPDEVMALYTHT